MLPSQPVFSDCPTPEVRSVCWERISCPRRPGHSLVTPQSSIDAQSSCSSSSPLASRPIDCSPSSRQAHTTTSRPSRSKHRRIPGNKSSVPPSHLCLKPFVAKSSSDEPQHIRHYEESYMAPPYVDLIQMANSTISCGNGNVF